MSPAANDFVHLHVHSEYSLLDGANRIGPMLEYVKTLGQDTIALTDHGVLFGALEFYNKATANGIKPIIGCEVYITPKHRTTRGAGEQKNTHHLLLLAENYTGYLNLCKLSSIGYTEGFYYKPRIDFETLEKHKEGLIATSSCLAGLIPQRLLANDFKRAAEYTGQFVDMFGKERFFMELMDHGIREQSEANSGIIELARKQDLRLIATNDCHYMRREDAEMHDALLCVQMGARLADRDRMRFDTSEFYVKSTEEMAALFKDLPEAILNTRLVAEMCNLQMPKMQYRLPKFPCPEGMTETDLLTKNVWDGARERYGDDIPDSLKDRIQFELDTIIRMGFPAYFLIVADFINHARSVGIPVGPGRGSAAGSVVAYSLKITQLDPLEHGLLFERFLNPDRLSMPDIDIDFCFERRSDVIEYVRQKYGDKCVAQIITFGTMKAKAAVRDIGRVMDIPLNVVDKVAKAIPNDLKMTLPKAVNESNELRGMMEQDPQIDKLVKMAMRIEGMVRHASTHAAGIIISDRDITDYCPLYKAPNEDRAATQFTMTECEEHLGLLKMDFLGIKNLTIIDRVVKWLRERDGIDIDWDKIPMSDPKTYQVLQLGQTPGVFQLESDGMTNLVKRLKPSEFADLTALLAIYRPGPLQAGMHDMYVERKHGRQKVEYDHPTMEPILKETYGVILYQEQVMRISMDMCGFTRGQADMLRKAMGKKKKDVMDKMEAQFIEGAAKTSNVPGDLAKRIWDNIVTFAGYGFNKSHSAAYAVVTFQTAYLRAHYQTYFLAALLTNEISGTSEAIAKYVANCREVGVEVLPANVNRSREYFNPDDDRIWFALNGVKGVGTGFAQAIVREREADGPFKSLQDFCMRIPREEINSRMVEALIKVGAFDELHKNRASLLAALPEIMQLASDVQKQADTAQDDMFNLGGEDAEPLIPNIQLPNIPPWDDKERAAFEKEFLGFYLSDHPLKRYEIELRSFSSVHSGQLEEMTEGLNDKSRVPITIVGYITDIRVLTNKQGDPWGIVQFEDLQGHFDCKFWSKEFETYRTDLQLDTVVQVEGSLSVWNSRPSITGNVVRRAEELRGAARGVELDWPAEKLTRQALFELTEICKRFPGPKSVRVCVHEKDKARVDYPLGTGVKLGLSAGALEALVKLPGLPKVRFITDFEKNAETPAPTRARAMSAR